jgi:pimeloyl-ACP methyl ester carboxylesterase
MAWLQILVGVILGLAVLSYVSFLAGRWFFVPRYPDEIHFGTTDDGWRIAVIRYRPMLPTEAGKPSRQVPVLLVHGLAANRYNLDFTDDLSLARDLAARGFDVWLVELRGRGYSLRPRLFSNVKYNWCFDDYAERDLPCAAAVVARVTGAAKLHLVGFSTGALACYAWLSDPHRKIDVASLVSIGGAASFRRLGRALSGRLIRSVRFLRHRWFLRVLAPISGHWHPSPLQIVYNPENADGPTQRRAMVNMIANFSRNELLQYSDWIMNDVFRSIDQRRDYRAELGRVTVPTLLVAGPRDVLSPPDAVKETHDALGAVDKQFVICSRAQGRSVNYGHFDLVIGKKAPDEIYPLVAGWLCAHDSAQEQERRDGDGNHDDNGGDTEGGEGVSSGLVLGRAEQDRQRLHADDDGVGEGGEMSDHAHDPEIRD